MTKKYIGILTINDDSNYGNRLQNFALYHLLHKYSDCITIKSVLQANTRFKQIIKLYVPNFIILANQKLHTLPLLGLSNKILEVKRIVAGARFTKKYVPDNIFKVSSSGLMRLRRKELGFVVIGSDQVWNYRWLTNKDLALRLGSFVPDDVPIISYAASFGVSDVPNEVRSIFRNYLPRLKAISVREDRGRELVREMTGVEAAVVLDPTLMLTSDQWNKITRGFVPDGERYVLTYFLGRPSNEQECVIQEYAKEHDCRIRRIFDIRDKHTYVAGPQDFVELFSKAEYVFTDSYHACCFSILYHRQFTVFNRSGSEGKANMNSRMETLFRLFDLDSVVLDEGLAPVIDYSKVDRLLAQHREESQTWLDKAMEV